MVEENPVTLPQLDPFSVESTPSSKLDAWLKSRHQLGKEEREKREGISGGFQQKLQVETANKMEQLELQSGSGSTGMRSRCVKLAAGYVGHFDTVQIKW